MIYEIEFKNNWSSENILDKPREYLTKLPDELLNLVIGELKEIAMDPYNIKKTHDLREPWEGFMGWYPDKRTKLKDYRIVYRVEKKVQIYRIGLHKEVYKKK